MCIKEVTMNRLYDEKYNNQGSLMKIVEYNRHSDIVVEFQDDYNFRVNTTYGNFIRGCVKNPYAKSVYGVGMIGIKYPVSINCVHTREYKTWNSMLQRCFSELKKKKYPYYKDVVCCEEWLLFDNFYEWLQSQGNVDKWLHGKRWALDKDIIIKNNKLYSPETCCLVPQNVNCLLLKRDSLRGDLPIGVKQNCNKFEAYCGNPFTKKSEHLGFYNTPEEAFYVYKLHRENHIKQMAKQEYEAGNITNVCYEALMNYSIEIDD